MILRNKIFVPILSVVSGTFYWYLGRHLSDAHDSIQSYETPSLQENNKFDTFWYEAENFTILGLPENITEEILYENRKEATDSCLKMRSCQGVTRYTVRVGKYQQSLLSKILT